MGTHQYFNYLCGISIFLLLGGIGGYLIHVRLPLSQELQQLEEAEQHYALAKQHLQQKIANLQASIKKLEDVRTLALSEVQQRFATIPSVQNLQIQESSASPTISKSTRTDRWGGLKRALSRDTVANRQILAILNRFTGTSQDEKKPTPVTMNIAFSCDYAYLPLCMASVEHLSQYGVFPILRCQNFPDATEKVQVSLRYQIWPLDFHERYRPAPIPETPESGTNPFRMPSLQERRLVQDDIAHLVVQQIFYNPVQAGQSLALLNNRLVGVGDAIGNVFIQAILPERVVVGYYGEFSLAVPQKQ